MNPLSENIRIYTRQNLTPRQEAAALALATGKNYELAAQDSHCSVPTIKSWLANHPGFKVRIRELRAEITSRAVGILVEGMIEAAMTLRQLLRCTKEPIKLKAAEALLTHGVQMTALAELQDRIDDLENGRG
jgi:hypothetical protein